MPAQTTGPVPTRVHTIAQRHPNRTALQESRGVLNYRDLDRLSACFAHHLFSRGVQHGDVVALCMPRSIDSIVAALGILRLGAAYMPLDSSWPDPRLRFALKDSGAKAVVAERHALNRLKGGIPEIDILDDAWRALPDAPPSFNAVHPNDVAYVIYTSGSTGNPKGVEITHANLSHLVNWHLKDFHLTHRDRTSHLASLGFDAAVWEIWPTLCAGATLCIASDPVRLSTDLLQNWLMHEQITVSFVPTIQATALINKDWPSQTALRFMLTGADVLTRGPHKRIPFVLVNNYGPTECTVVASSGPVTVGSDQIPTIGKSIRGAAIYILDIDAQPVPDGELGEIYIGGAGVGRGYRNLPDETQFAFLPDPFSFVPGARMYKTGDLGVRRSNGEIEFRGRIDRQVKINGKRVELSEIDSVLARHQDLSFATTQARIGSQGEIRLIAYVVARSSEVALSADQLRAHLSQALPSYMVPLHFVRLPSIPLLSNGKLDQNALEMGSPFDLGAGIMSVRQSQLGDRLLVVVQDLLKHPGLSKEDDFFLAGGHSLFGMQLILQIEEEFGADLSLQQVLENPTVNRLSAEIEWVLDPSRKDAAPSLERNSPAPSPYSHSSATHRDATLRNPRLLPSMNCAHASKVKPLIQMNGLPRGVAALQPNTHRRTIFWIHYVHGNLARALGDEYGFVVIRMALEDFGEMERWPSAQAIARAMIKKILQVQPAGPFVIGGMCLGGVLAYEIASQLRTAGHEVSLLILADAFNPRDRSRYRSIGDLVSRAKYVLERARKLGVQDTLDTACVGLIRKLPRSLRRALAKNQVQKTQEIVESASLSYRPAPYAGPVLMILASDTSPHKRTEQGWRGLLDGSLRISMVDGHHTELMRSPAVDQIAQAILSHPVFAPVSVKQAEPEKSLDFAHN